jgi:general secretion pathway protein D
VRFPLFAIALLAIAPLLGAPKTSSQLQKEAQKAEKAGDITRAYLLYAEAAAQDPLNIHLWAKAKQLEAAAVGKLHTESVKPDLVSESGKIDSSAAGTITDQDIAETRRLLPIPELKGTAGLKDFNIRGDAKQIFEQVARSSGLEAVFDPAFQPKASLRLELSAVDFREALRAAEAATESFIVPISSSQFLVANDTQQKRTELDRTASIVIPVPEPFDVKDVQEIATGIRGTLDIQKLSVDAQRRLILIKDRGTKVRMAQKLILDLMKPRAQVAVEVQLITADQSSSLTYGLSLPNSINVAWFGRSSHLRASISPGNYVSLGGGKSVIGFSVADASLFAILTKSNSQTLIDSEVLAADGQAATFHVGDKYPIITAGYFGAATGTGQVYTPPPTVNFEDLGLVLKITPRVHGPDEVSLDLEAEFKLLGSQAVDGIPVISNRKFQSKVRVREGEWAVLAGLMTDSEGRNISGIAGLTSIPFLHKDNKTKSHGETLVVLKPHILIQPPSELVTHAAWYGTETKPRTPL